MAYSTVLVPERHHLMTNFRASYLEDLVNSGEGLLDSGKSVELADDFKFVFPVTSANHELTKRNPLPSDLRAQQIGAFSREFETPVVSYTVEDLGLLPGEEFAKYLVERGNLRTFGSVERMTPENTLVLTSTDHLMRQFSNLGYGVLPAEAGAANESDVPLPYEVVVAIASNPDLNTEFIQNNMHPSSLKFWKDSNFGPEVQRIFGDFSINEDGEFSEVLNLWPYLDKMDQAIPLKVQGVEDYITPGRIGDIGCAGGSLIKVFSNRPEYKDSTFYGVDISRSMIDVCNQRKERGDFGTPQVHFSPGNAYETHVFDRNSMDVIHTGSTTHEVLSSGGIEALKKFLKLRFDELAPGGVLVNRDVIGPSEPDYDVYVKLNSTNGRNDDYDKSFEDKEVLGEYLKDVSTAAMFDRFLGDFNPPNGNDINFDRDFGKFPVGDTLYHKMPIKTAMEFGFQNPYRGNWMSESRETLTGITPELWENLAKEAGFEVDPNSSYEVNDWIRKNHYEGDIDMYHIVEDELVPFDLPPTHMISVLRKPTI